LKAVQEALALLQIDTFGLSQQDRHYLIAIAEKFSGGPVGLDTLAASLNEDKVTLEEVVEPYLLQCGLIQRTLRGRQLTANGFNHLGLSMPTANSDSPASLL
jgi:Holliday junction DNA helicase RuvB